jgi:hypothetical protein
VRWLGRCSIGISSFSWNVISGSLGLATDGEAIISPDNVSEDGTHSTANISFGNIDEGNPPRHFEIVHVDDVDAYDNGAIFNPVFLERCSNFGTLRFVHAKSVNGNLVSKWEHERPESYISYGENYCYCLPGAFLGTTTNDGDDFSLAAEGFVLEDKTGIVFLSNAETTTPANLRLNVNGTGFVPLRSNAVSVLGTNTLASGVYSVAIYDETLNVWMTKRQSGFRAGMPVSIMLKLCKEAGAHPSLPLYHLAVDPPTDYVAGLAQACKTFAETEAPWMVPVFEGPNEEWNPGAAFEQTQYGWAKALERWGANFDHNNHYGRVLSLMSGAIAAVYNDPSKYKIHCGVQAVQNASSAAARIAGKHVSIDGGIPASAYNPTIVPAIYFSTGFTVQQEMDAGWALSQLETDEEKQAYADAFLATGPDAASLMATSTMSLKDVFARWSTFATENSLEFGSYEGGPHWDAGSGDRTASITAISKAAQAVLTVGSSAVKPPVGLTLSIAGGDMMEIIGGPYEVLAVDGDDITIDFDSSEATDYTTGATATYVGSGDIIFGLRRAMRHSELMSDLLQKMQSQYHLYGGVDPSSFDLTGGTFGFCDPTIYDPLPVYDGAVAFSTGAKPVQFRVRGQAA